jgi:hypothetical protein
MIDDLTMRRQMVERYVREDALVDAALARGDRERPLTIGTNWKYLNAILAGGEGGEAAERFFLGAPRLGEDVGYGPAGLHDPSAVAAFASYLELWTPERFGAAAAARRSANLPAGLAVHRPRIFRSTIVTYGSFRLVRPTSWTRPLRAPEW